MKRLRGLAMLIAASMAITGCTSSPPLIAHRGASYLAPENTVAAANLAWEKNADAVEVDVFLSSDKQVVVIHDSTTKRTAGVELEVATTPASRLRQLDVGSFKGAAYVGEPIPLLEEVIATVPPGKQLFVEIKCGPEVLSPLENVIEAGGKRDQIVIIGFSFETVEASKRLMSDIPTYWLVGTGKNEETKAWVPHNKTLIHQAASSGLDGLNVHWAGITPEFADAVRDAGLGLYTWTVNDPVEAKRLARLGIDGITTDRPGWLRRQLRGIFGPIRLVQSTLRGHPAKEQK